VSGSRGSAKDTQKSLAGAPRYACSQDGLFLRGGDGWLESLGQGRDADSITLRAPGDRVLFKLPGLKGRKITLELSGCGSAEGRVRFRFRGGSDRDGLEDVVAEDQWAALSVTGSAMRIGPIPVPADAYFISVERLRTPDAEVAFAFDSYAITADSPAAP
jgi:hypothetical protein